MTSTSRVALITGVGGQDGYYLTRLLLTRGYEVHGILRRACSKGRIRLELLGKQVAGAAHRIFLHTGDVTDAEGMTRIVRELEPHEIYNLAAQSHVRASFDRPGYTEQVNAIGALNVLEAARKLDSRKAVRVYQASSSEMFGGLPGTGPQNERTAFHPRSPYGCSKVAAFHHTVNYREAYNLFACNGILFNHESPIRSETFVTRKITMAAARIRAGLQADLVLGNLDARRDWGYAADYVEAMWLMLQQNTPGDFVIATGEAHSVRDFAEAAFAAVGLDWREFTRTDPNLLRPAEVDVVCGDASKARRVLRWNPRTPFRELVKLMVDYDARQARRESRPVGESQVESPRRAA